VQGVVAHFVLRVHLLLVVVTAVILEPLVRLHVGERSRKHLVRWMVSFQTAFVDKVITFCLLRLVLAAACKDCRNLPFCHLLAFSRVNAVFL
jgi:hypothetical protein